MTVRRAEKRDLDQVAGLISDFHQESKYDAPPIVPEKVKHVLEAYEQTSSEQVFFEVITHPNNTGRVVGFMIAERIPDLWTSALRTVEIMLYVQPAYRGTYGAGKLMFDFADWARRFPGYIRIEASGGVDNEHAAKLYKRLGYEPRGTLHGMEVH